MKSYLDKKLSRYFKGIGSVEEKLLSLMQSINPFNIGVLQKKIIKMVASPLQWNTFFKLLILINKLLIDSQLEPEAAANILQAIQICTKNVDESMLTLINKLLIPYKLYLQKRCAINLKGIPQEKQAFVFQLLNLINSGTSFSHMLFILGRYYRLKIAYAADFNVVLAEDISFVYMTMMKILVPPVSNAFLGEIEQIHQKMYVVFYNCYFSRVAAKYRPKWIKTDVIVDISKKKSVTMQSQKLQTIKKEILEIAINQEGQYCQNLKTNESTPERYFLQSSQIQHFKIRQFSIDEKEEDLQVSRLSAHKQRLERLKLIQSMERMVKDSN